VKVTVDELTTTSGIVAIAAAGAAVVCLILLGVMFFKLRRLRNNQTLVLGDKGERDLVTHAAELTGAVANMRDLMDEATRKFESDINGLHLEINRCISHVAVVRYDAYKEMGGQQSSSMAFLDASGSGLVISSILHREQARVYIKELDSGRSEIKLSPEEDAAVKCALENLDGKVESFEND